MAKEIQAVIFSKKAWSDEAARAWLYEHDFDDESKNEDDVVMRFVQLDDGEFDAGTESLMSTGLPDGVTMVECDTERSVRDAMKKVDTLEPEVKVYVAETKTLKNGDVEAFVSTEDVDRVGDIIRVKGWELDNFIKSGSPVLWSHGSGSDAHPPVANAVAMEKHRKGLLSVTRFHGKTELSRDLATLYGNGLMKSFSVGFQPLERPTQRKSEETEEFQGYIFTRQELLEYSCVSVPANPNAVTRMFQKGQIGRGIMNVLLPSSPSADMTGAPDDEATQDIVQHLRLRQALREKRRWM